MFSRILYLGYYVRQLDRKKWVQFSRYAADVSGKSMIYLWLDSVWSVIRYNISLLEYFQFRFYGQDAKERKKWAGTGYMYEYQRYMNPPIKREVLNDKTAFYKAYRPFFLHAVGDMADLEASDALFEALRTNPSRKLVLKEAEGKCGLGVTILPVDQFADATALAAYMRKEGFDLVEGFIIQHPALQALSPSAVNTIRIFTQLTPDDQMIILGCRLRISVNSPVDNMAAGNMAAYVDDETGRVTGPGVYSDPSKQASDTHPITGVPINGFQIPQWDAILGLVRRAALHQRENRSIGWDVVLTEQGPGLIEGNHDWCKLVFQLPDHSGRRELLSAHWNAYMQRKHVS
jgi:hypothetical protein